MASAVRSDPFSAWREQQRAAEAAAPPRAWADLQLSPLREARVLVAWCDWRLARLRAATPVEITVGALLDDREWQIYTAVTDKAWAEQAAEDLDELPSTIDGCIAVLDVAARIITALGPHLEIT